MLAHLRMQRVAIALRHIRWIRDNCIERWLPGNGTQQVRLQKAYAIGDPVARGVVAGDGERGRGDVERRYL